jgi:adenosylcobyric acid synthase
MWVAKYIKAPVLIVADIERGGVFAQLYGTVQLLRKDERERVKGFIINKFRGDKEILEPGIRKMEKILRKKFVGLIPYIEELGMEDEDSLSLPQREEDGSICIKILHLPHASNTTDFLPLAQPGIRLIWERRDLSGADCIILPGTKNTMEDLLFLWRSGLATQIMEEKEKGTFIMGVCGGYQMLGEWVFDSRCAHSKIKRQRGLGLLPIVTFLRTKKLTKKVVAYPLGAKEVFGLKGFIEGYRIHVGKTIAEDGTPAFSIDGEREGVFFDGVFGTYIHGLFENEEFLNSFLAFISKGRLKHFKFSRQERIKRIANIVKRCMDLNFLYSLLFCKNGTLL